MKKKKKTSNLTLAKINLGKFIPVKFYSETKDEQLKEVTCPLELNDIYCPKCGSNNILVHRTEKCYYMLDNITEIILEEDNIEHIKLNSSSQMLFKKQFFEEDEANEIGLYCRDCKNEYQPFDDRGEFREWITKSENDLKKNAIKTKILDF